MIALRTIYRQPVYEVTAGQSVLLLTKAELLTLRGAVDAALIEADGPLDLVVDIVARAHGVTPEAIYSKNKQEYACTPRHIIMWVLRKRGWTLERVGKAIGNRHHRAVMHSCKTVENRRSISQEHREVTDSLLAKVNEQLDGKESEVAV